MTVGIPQRIVVVGGGIAGFAAATELRARGYDGRLTLVEGGGEPYDRPPLSKDYLLGAVSREQLALARPGWFAQHDVDLHTDTRVAGVDRDGTSVVLADGGVLPADIVVIATGARPRRLPESLGDVGGIHTLGTIEDADRLRAVLVPGAHIAVIGAGLVGAELASTAVALGATATIISRPELPLAAVGDELAHYLHARHAEHGVRVVEGSISAVAGRGPVRVTLTSVTWIEPYGVAAGNGYAPATTIAV